MTEHHSHKVDHRKCHDCGMRFSKTNLFVNFGLGIIKGIVGFLSGSRALLAASLYSINDVLSAVIVIISLKVGGRPADEDHAYGHGKAEFVAIAVISFVMVTAVFLIVFYSMLDIVRGVDGPPHVAAFFVALLGMLVGEFLARMGFCAARNSDDSPALQSSAEHNRADALSSLAVAVGVGGAVMGLHVLDPIVAIFETFHIAIISGTFFGKAIKGLMDTSMPPQKEKHICRVCAQVPGVSQVELLRTRRMGNKSCVDMVINVSGDISVEQADSIGTKVKSAIMGVLGRSLESHVRFKAGGITENMGPDGGKVKSHG